MFPKTTIRDISVSLLGALAFTGGCIDADGPSVAPIARAPRGGGGDPCTQAWRCGSNSPVLNNEKGFHELNLYGEPNDAGLRLHSPAMVLHETTFNLAIERGKIVGYSDDGATVLAGPDLVGAEIWLDTEDQSPAYKIDIRDVRPMTFPFGTPDPVETYVFGWRDAAGTSSGSNLCANPPYDLLNRSGGQNNRDSAAFAELLGMDPDTALVFEGDRIFPTTKTMNMDQDWDRSWFNIGCAGDTIAKLHLTRNTLASRSSSYRPTHAKRQAALKLLTGDYCGTGRAFTVPGQPLQWKGHWDDPRNYYFAPIAGIEARWNENGATCLTTPRMTVSTLDSAYKYFPDVWSAIDEECDRPPPCQPLDPDFIEADMWVSANPGDPSPPVATIPPSGRTNVARLLTSLRWGTLLWR